MRDRLRADGFTNEERDWLYRLNHGQLTEEERAEVRAYMYDYIHTHRWRIRRRRLAAWLWGADEGLPMAWYYGRWALYTAVTIIVLRYLATR